MAAKTVFSNVYERYPGGPQVVGNEFKDRAMAEHMALCQPRSWRIVGRLRITYKDQAAIDALCGSAICQR